MPFVNRLLLAGILSVVLQCLMVNADKEVFHMLNLNQEDYNRYNAMNTFENGELVVDDSWTVELGPPNQEGLITLAITEYPIDKEKRLSESFLKSASG